MELYHVLNRGVDKRKVFLEEEDYVRFLHDMYVFNDLTGVDSNHRFTKTTKETARKQLVDIHAYCLMPNHYHFLLSEREEGGMSLFMRKLNMGYAKYFNEKYKRPGILWQGTFKKILIQRDAHFFYMPFYIHLNPLDMHMYEWRTGDVKNARKALTELKKYRWSSFLDYNQIKNMPSLLQKKLLADILGTPKEQERVIADIISNPDLASVADKLE